MTRRGKVKWAAAGVAVAVIVVGVLSALLRPGAQSPSPALETVVPRAPADHPREQQGAQEAAQAAPAPVAAAAAPTRVPAEHPQRSEGRAEPVREQHARGAPASAVSMVPAGALPGQPVAAISRTGSDRAGDLEAAREELGRVTGGREAAVIAALVPGPADALPERSDAAGSTLRLVEPADERGFTHAQQTVSLRWSSQRPQERFRLQVARSAAFAQPIVDEELSSTEFDFRPEVDAHYVWRVCSVGAGGSTGECSSARAFHVAGRGSATNARRFGGPATRAPDPEGITLTAPRDNWIARKSSMLVEGRAERPAEVIVQGKHVRLDAQGRFSTWVRLQPGANSIVVERVEAATGERSFAVRNVIYKRTASESN